MKTTKSGKRKLPPPPPPKTPKTPLLTPKDPVEVYCRLRPLDRESELCCVAVNSTTVQLTAPPGALQTARTGNIKETQATFKFVFDEKTSQKGLFDHAALPLVSDLLNGKNGLLFTYGVTGSGKTFTMTGTPQDGGLLPRSLDVIFNSIKELQSKKFIFKQDKMNAFDVQSEADAMLERQAELGIMNMRTPYAKTPRRKDDSREERIPDLTKVDSIDEDNVFALFVSYIEIYNNYVYDLLDESTVDLIKPRPPQSKILREDASHNMYVHGCTEVEVKSTDEAFEAFYRGQKRRRVAHTSLNTESSRSHSVFTLRLVQAPLDPSGREVFQEKQTISISQLSLVDLAGSERTIRTRNKGDRLREAGNINNSLMVLRTCIENLRDNQLNGTNKMVPYRDSKLTHLFKNYFDGEGKVRMIVCINPGVDDYDENIHVVRFAELTQEVQVTRSTPLKIDIGLMPGRRRANQLKREVVVQDEIIIRDPLPCNLFPPCLFPSLELLDPEDLNTLKNLLLHLESDEKKRSSMADEVKEKLMELRVHFIDLEKENTLLKKENGDLKVKIQYRDEIQKKIEQKLRVTENSNELLQRRLNNFEHVKATLVNELDEKNMKLNQKRIEKVKLKAYMEDRFANETEKMKRELTKRFKDRETELETKMWVKNEKLKTLRDIVSDQWVPPENGAPAKRTGMVTRSKATRSASPPPPLTNVPVANPRHRRSHSAGNEQWLDHNPPGTVELGTVLQPKIKKHRSVTRLNVNDVANSDKYMLTHQEQDRDGDISTHYYKGNVIPSAGGGAQVIFNDVEILKQTSPGDRNKRSSDGQIKGQVSTNEIETRCATSIEGHSRRKKTKQ